MTAAAEDVVIAIGACAMLTLVIIYIAYTDRSDTM